MSDTDWFIVAFFSVFLVVGVIGMRKVLMAQDASVGQRIAGLLFFSPFVIVGAVPILGAVSLYTSRHYASDAAVTPPPWQYPAQAYYPRFCAFGSVGMQVQPPKYTLAGKSRLAMDRALAYVEDANWPVGWRRYDRIIQGDAVVIGYTNGSMEVDYTFVRNADGGSDCYLYWPRRE